MNFNSPVTITKARKPHLCSWCGERIEKGEIYHRRFCFWDGRGSTIKQHPECDHAETHLYEVNETHEWDCHTFHRGCVCEYPDKGHGAYPHCKIIKESMK